jgi:hypothetical protein
MGIVGATEEGILASIATIERVSVADELGVIAAKGRHGTAELLEIIANQEDARMPAAARLSLAPHRPRRNRPYCLRRAYVTKVGLQTLVIKSF